MLFNIFDKGKSLPKATVGFVNYYGEVTRVNYITIFEKITEKDRKMGKYLL